MLEIQPVLDITGNFVMSRVRKWLAPHMDSDKDVGAWIKEKDKNGIKLSNKQGNIIYDEGRLLTPSPFLSKIAQPLSWSGYTGKARPPAPSYFNSLTHH